MKYRVWDWKKKMFIYENQEKIEKKYIKSRRYSISLLASEPSNDSIELYDYDIVLDDKGNKFIVYGMLYRDIKTGMFFCERMPKRYRESRKYGFFTLKGKEGNIMENGPFFLKIKVFFQKNKSFYKLYNQLNLGYTSSAFTPKEL